MFMTVNMVNERAQANMDPDIRVNTLLTKPYEYIFNAPESMNWTMDSLYKMFDSSTSGISLAHRDTHKASIQILPYGYSLYLQYGYTAVQRQTAVNAYFSS